MADEGSERRRPVKQGVRRGGGPPPGYEWDVDVFDLAHREALGFLNEAQVEHMQALVKELAKSSDPTHSDTIDVRPIDDFHEIKDKGGVLGNIAARVFFCVDHELRTLVVLGAMKKEAEGQTPTSVKVRIRRRMREYFERFRGMDS